MKANEIMMMIQAEIADHEDVISHKRKLLEEKEKEFLECKDEAERKKLALRINRLVSGIDEHTIRASALRIMIDKIEYKAGHMF